MSRKTKVNGEVGEDVSAVDAYTVLQPFQDSDEYKTSATPHKYEVGEDVSHFEERRLASLVERGLVLFTKGKESEA